MGSGINQDASPTHIAILQTPRMLNSGYGLNLDSQKSVFSKSSMGSVKGRTPHQKMIEIQTHGTKPNYHLLANDQNKDPLKFAVSRRNGKPKDSGGNNLISKYDLYRNFRNDHKTMAQLEGIIEADTSNMGSFEDNASKINNSSNTKGYSMFLRGDSTSTIDQIGLLGGNKTNISAKAFLTNNRPLFGFRNEGHINPTANKLGLLPPYSKFGGRFASRKSYCPQTSRLQEMSKQSAGSLDIPITDDRKYKRAETLDSPIRAKMNHN